ncbi:hypothetical protein L1887_31993 [Cichorium endivia]|nr:hypothetical protein L1887_31993 [Cichorium endivia]
MGTGSPLNTYASPPPVPGDFYPLVPSHQHTVPELIDIVLQDRRFHLSKYATYNMFSFRDSKRWISVEKVQTESDQKLGTICMLVVF